MKTKAKRLGRSTARQVSPFWRRWEKMTDAERDEFVKQYDREIDPSEATPVSRTEQARHDRAIARAKARRGVGRPRLGAGAKNVLVTFERGMLKQLDAYVSHFGLTRSEVVRLAVRAVLAAPNQNVRIPLPDGRLMRLDVSSKAG